MIYHYTIDEIPPSLNRYAGRQNVWQYRLVSLTCRPKPKEPIKKAEVAITYYFADKRRRDPDNYAGKMILDGLTAAGVIIDDSFDCIQLVLGGRVDPKRPRTEINITPME